jgi:hypothetical protein
MIEGSGSVPLANGSGSEFGSGSATLLQTLNELFVLGEHGEGGAHVCGAYHVCAGPGPPGGSPLHRRLHLHSGAGSIPVIQLPFFQCCGSGSAYGSTIALIRILNANPDQESRKLT